MVKKEKMPVEAETPMGNKVMLFFYHAVKASSEKIVANVAYLDFYIELCKTLMRSHAMYIRHTGAVIRKNLSFI